MAEILFGFKSVIVNSDFCVVVPVVVYSNADVEKVSIVKNNRGKAGVYCWVNNESGLRYVGSSIDLGKRLLQYYNLKHLMKVHMHIYKALLKHGHSKFTLEILEYCDIDCTIAREQYYIDILNPTYNILRVAGSPLGYRHTQESIEKLKILGTGRKHSEEAKAKIKAARVGSIIEEEVRLKISSSKLKANLKHSSSAKLKIGLASLARNGRVTYVTNIETGLVDSYASRRAAAIALNIAPLSLKRYLESGKVYNGLYKITDYKH